MTSTAPARARESASLESTIVPFIDQRRMARPPPHRPVGSILAGFQSDEESSGAFDVLANLIGQFESRPKLALSPQQAMKIDAHHVVIDVGIEVENMALDRDGVVLVQCWAHADIGHAFEVSGECLEAGRGHVHPRSWEKIVGRIDVHGGEADLTAELSPGGDP